MNLPSSPLADTRVALILSLVGVLLIAGGGVPYALSLANDSTDYRVSLAPAQNATVDVDAESLSDADRAILANATLTSTSLTPPQETDDSTGAIGESRSAPLDRPPEGLSDGDIVHIAESNQSPSLVAVDADGNAIETYRVAITKEQEPFNLTLFSMFILGMFTLSAGLKKRSDVRHAQDDS